MPTIDQSSSQRIREKKTRTLSIFHKHNPTLRQQGSVSMGLDNSIYMDIKEGGLFLSKECCSAPAQTAANTKVSACPWKCTKPQSFSSVTFGGMR
jgi:hypothetical protein